MNKKFTAATTFLGEYANKRKLGKGAFGDVFLVQNKNAQLFAMKIIDRQKMSGDNADMIDYLKDEIKCMKQMKYRNIVKLYDFKEDKEFYYMILQYCDGGDLVNLQATFPDRVFNLQTATQYLSQVIYGLQALHHAGYLHRDIKLQNVLLKNQNGMKILKIADFGFAKKAVNLGGTVLGTEQYMSPEIYRCGIEDGEDQIDLYGYEVDMWAFGVLFYYMLNMAFPFELNPYWTIQQKYKELSNNAKNFSYKKAVMTTRKKAIDNCTEEMEDLFHKMFHPNVDKRINFSQIRQHPVFAKRFPGASVQSQILYKKKFVSSLIKKGNGGLRNNLKSRASELENKQKIGLSTMSVIEEEKDFPKEKEIVRLQFEEINFLWNIVEEIQLVEKQIGNTKSLMFAYNMVKYYTVLLGNFIKGLTVTNYSAKFSDLQWKLLFNTPQFKAQKKQFALKLSKAEMKFQEIYKKCRCKIDQISQLNEYFKNAFTDYIDEKQEFEGDFFRSFRKSTDILYKTLKEFLKTNKIKQFYFYLCIVCICHVYNDFYQDQDLKKLIFSDYLDQETEQTALFSYEKFVYYLRNCGKQGVVRLTKKVIEECMMRK